MRIMRSWRLRHGLPVAHRGQTGTATRTRTRPEPEPQASITKTSSDEKYTHYRITLPHLEAAKFDAALASHREALVAEWKHDHDTGADASRASAAVAEHRAAFLRLVDAGWDAEVAARPHGQQTTVVVHLDVKDKIAGLHLGPLLSDADRRYLTCDATCEVWFERAGQPIGAGRATRLISRRLRRALEYRHPTCAVPGCGATRGSACPSHRALGRRRRHRVGQPGAAVPLSSPAAPSGRHHHHRTRRGSVGHRQRRPTLSSDRWPAHRPDPHRRSHPAPDPPGNAPTGGGTNPSNQNHH